MARQARRNVLVERAVDAALERIDSFLKGERLVGVPSKNLRDAIAGVLASSPSYRVAGLFLAFYALLDSEWDFDKVPIGIRGTYGDKRLSDQLSRRHITLHDGITAFGENVGWKGNVANVRLQQNGRLRGFLLALQKAEPYQRQQAADYLATEFARSRSVPTALPPVDDGLLTFSRAKKLLLDVLEIQSEGHVQQFLVAALFKVHRRRFGTEIRTHNPHGSDTSDRTSGDIEEFDGGRLVRSYEVTVRPDWKNRLTDFRRKMDKFGLSKYVIIASGVNADDELAIPARLIAFLAPLERDIAVVDILDLVNVMAAELSALELREAVNLAYDFLLQPKLSGRPKFQKAFRDVVEVWLDL